MRFHRSLVVELLSFALLASVCVGVRAEGWQWAFPRPQGNDLHRVEYLGGKFVAVGDHGTILTSLDGSDWSTVESGAVVPLTDVAFNGATFVAVGKDGTILTSDDGNHWNGRDSGTTSSLRRICWTDGRFLAVGDNDVLLESSDGILWTQIDTGYLENDVFQTISWNGSRFVIVTFYGAILSSSDLVAWTVDEEFIGLTVLNDVLWDGRQFVAVGGTNAFDTNLTTIVTSSDGLVWTSQDVGTGRLLTAVAYDGRQLVAVGGTLDDDAVLTSSDGVHWFDQLTSTTPPLGGVATDGIRFVAAGASGTLLSSDDGAHWASSGRRATRRCREHDHHVGRRYSLDTTIVGRTRQFARRDLERLAMGRRRKKRNDRHIGKRQEMAQWPFPYNGASNRCRVAR
jgi:hypothetical protein